MVLLAACSGERGSGSAGDSPDRTEALPPATTSTTTSPTTATRVPLTLDPDLEIETLDEADALLAETDDDGEPPAPVADAVDDALQALIDGTTTGDEFFDQARPVSSSRLLVSPYLICDPGALGQRCAATPTDYLRWVDQCRETGGSHVERRSEGADRWAAVGVCFWPYTDEMEADAERLLVDQMTSAGYEVAVSDQYRDVARRLATEVASNGRNLAAAIDTIQAQGASLPLGPGEVVTCNGAGYSVAPARLGFGRLELLDWVDGSVETAGQGQMVIGVGIAWSDKGYDLIVCLDEID